MGEPITIVPILNSVSSSAKDNRYVVLWLRESVDSLEINSECYENASSSIYFLSPLSSWSLCQQKESRLSGYVIYLDRETLNHPLLKNLHIHEVRFFNSGKIPKINLAPGIEKRTLSILEMLDELIGSNLNHKEEAVISLLHAFFVYCDGQCNIKSTVTGPNSKKALVYKFKKLLDRQIQQHHKVGEYAEKLNVSAKYLNECVREILKVNAKQLINEQLLLKSRHELKFTDKTVKEISYQLGFSSPDYFSYFFKNHTGTSPTVLREN